MIRVVRIDDGMPADIPPDSCVLEVPADAIRATRTLYARPTSVGDAYMCVCYTRAGEWSPNGWVVERPAEKLVKVVAAAVYGGLVFAAGALAGPWTANFESWPLVVRVRASDPIARLSLRDAEIHVLAQRLASLSGRMMPEEAERRIRSLCDSEGVNAASSPEKGEP